MAVDFLRNVGTSAVSWDSAEQEDWGKIEVIAIHKIQEMREAGQEAIKVSRQVSGLNHSYVILDDSTILRCFHSRDKSGNQIHPVREGLIIPVEDIHFKRPKKLFNSKGDVSHVFYTYVNVDEATKKIYLGRTGSVSREFKDEPRILNMRLITWEKKTGELEQGWIARYVAQDFFFYCNNISYTQPLLPLIELLIEIAKGVKSMHQNEWVHLDIKPENILVDNGKIFFIDFDSSQKVIDNQSISPRGTKEFVAPEVLLHRCSGFSGASKADIFSLGKTIADAATFVDDSWMTNQVEKPISELKALSSLKELPMDMIQSKASARPSIDIVISRLENIRQKALI